MRCACILYIHVCAHIYTTHQLVLDAAPNGAQSRVGGSARDGDRHAVHSCQHALNAELDTPARVAGDVLHGDIEPECDKPYSE